ncbi:hypothetical protein [Arthrobacter sp. R1-13]
MSAMSACIRSLMMRNSRTAIAAAAISSSGTAPSVWVHPSMVMILL